MGFIHAELMAQYAEDAKVHDDPWEFWQHGASGIWVDCVSHPGWRSDSQYRRKPSQKYESLRLAEVLDALDVGAFKNSLLGKAAAELRRQHARIAELDEQMTGCIELLKRTPKITREIYVGKDRQAWGVQAKVVLDAAIAAQANQGEKK